MNLESGESSPPESLLSVVLGFTQCKTSLDGTPAKHGQVLGLFQENMDEEIKSSQRRRYIAIAIIVVVAIIIVVVIRTPTLLLSFLDLCAWTQSLSHYVYLVTLTRTLLTNGRIFSLETREA